MTRPRRSAIPLLLGPPRVLAGIGLAVLLGLAAGPASAEGSRGALAALSRFDRAPALRGATSSIALGPLHGDALWLERDARRALVPASNQKILLSSAVLAHWGPTHRFSTPVYAEGGVDEDGVIQGALWLEGRGDPSLVSEQMLKLAEEIRLAGVREVRGGLGVDASYFDRERWHADWVPISRRAYHAPVAALAANYSSFRIDVRPGAAPGRPASVAVAPLCDYFRVRSDATTLGRSGAVELDLGVLPDGSGERVRIRGALEVGRPARSYYRSVALPEHYAASVLRRQLEAQGVRVQGALRIGTRPPEAEEIVVFEGAPLTEIVWRLNKYSNNFIAEQLLKALGADRYGAPGSWDKGVRAIEEHLASLGLDPAAVVVADGSGLSPRNRVSAATLIRVIRRTASSFTWGPEFLASLPLGGFDGTLEDRMEDAARPVRGKTGHLRAVSSLSGLMPNAAGEPVVFSILVNGASGGMEAVDAAIDALVDGLAAIDGRSVEAAAASPGGDAPAQRRISD